MLIGYSIAYNLFVSNIFPVDMSCKMLFFHLESLGCIQYIPHLLRALSSLPPTNSSFSCQQVLQSIHPACAQNTFRSHHHLPQYCLNSNVPTWQYISLSHVVSVNNVQFGGLDQTNTCLDWGQRPRHKSGTFHNHKKCAHQASECFLEDQFDLKSMLSLLHKFEEGNFAR